MAANRKKVLEIAYSTKKHAKQLRELEELIGVDILDDSAACRNYLLKGFQRFLFVCTAKGIPVNQAIINLSVQGRQFDSGAECHASISELMLALEAMESGLQINVTTPEPVDVTVVKTIPTDPVAGQTADDASADDWSAFGSVTGVSR